MKHIIAILFAFIPWLANAGGKFRTTQEILQTMVPQDTTCSTEIFANSLRTHANEIDELASPNDMRIWVYDTLQRPDVLTQVLDCPEFANLGDLDTVKFIPIQYTFPGGREIVINYQTQPKVLKQLILLGNKRLAPSDEVSPQISATDMNANWSYTDPAWYAIMVTQSGALKDFVGPDKNNTVSMQYIEDNISKLYPGGTHCTNKTALTKDDYMINKVMREKTINMDKDSNDYYVAGDKDLRWIMYAEIAAEIVLSVATIGAGTAVSATTKAARSRRVLTTVGKNMKRLSKMEDVSKYIKAEKELVTVTKRTDTLNDFRKTLQTEAKLEKQLGSATKGTKKYEQLAKELETVRSDKLKKSTQLGKEYENMKLSDVSKLDDLAKKDAKYADDLRKDMGKMKKESKNVKQYSEQADAYNETIKYMDALRSARNPTTGNVITRPWRKAKNIVKTMRASKNSKTINKAARAGRQGMKNGKVRDMLFHSTMQSLGVLGRATSTVGYLNLALTFLGDMYDATSVDSDEFTNGLKMKPLLLLSADDIQGQENKVNYGMWLMWTGDAISPEYDDAAYLQAMDFAQKFYQDLEETQTETGDLACDIDIYVVRPVVRNPGTPHQSLYWLIMNDEPWTTSMEK